MKRDIENILNYILDARNEILEQKSKHSEYIKEYEKIDKLLDKAERELMRFCSET